MTQFNIQKFKYVEKVVKNSVTERQNKEKIKHALIPLSIFLPYNNISTYMQIQDFSVVGSIFNILSLGFVIF